MGNLPDLVGVLAAADTEQRRVAEEIESFAPKSNPRLHGVVGAKVDVGLTAGEQQEHGWQRGRAKQQRLPDTEAGIQEHKHARQQGKETASRTSQVKRVTEKTEHRQSQPAPNPWRLAVA